MVREHLTSIELLGCGAAAGAVGKSVLAPVDRVKLMYMTSQHRTFTLTEALQTARSITQQSGVRGLWAGNGAAMMRVVPYSALTFTSFDRYEKLIQTTFGREKSIVTRLGAGAAAGATATLVTYPLDLLRTRMAAHWTATSPYGSLGPIGTMRQIVQAEGIGALWGGLGPTLVGIIPYGALSFGTYETLKSIARKNYPDADGPNGQPLVLRLGLGGVAGLTAQTATYPLHVVRRRMQVQAPNDPERYSGILQGLRRVYLEEGLVNGLFKGLSLTWLKGPFSVAIAFTLNDRLKGAIGGWWAAQPEAAATFREEIRKIDNCPEAVPRMKLTPIESLLAGGVAGAVAKTLIAPADRVKILYQVTPGRPFSLTSAWLTGVKILKNSGVRGLYRGNVAMLLRVVPYSGCAYYSFDIYEAGILKVLGKEQGGLGIGLRKRFGIEPGTAMDPVKLSAVTTRFLAGAAAGATATLVTYPLDLLRARMAAHWSKQPKYGTYRQAVAEIASKEGVGALWAGLGPTLIGIVPYAGLSFATYNTFKATYLARTGLTEDESIPTPLRLGAGAIAGLVAQSATYPLDVVRRRMQVQVAVDLSQATTAVIGPKQIRSQVLYTGVIQGMRVIYKSEGLAGLYKGLTMNWVKGPVAVSTSFAVNDLAKGWMRNRRETHGRPAGAGWLYYFGL